MDIDNKKLFNPEFSNHGYIQVYTGNGKGKTTAALGLAMRALGRSWKVLIVMFTKGGNDYGELISFAKLNPDLKDKVKIVQAGLDRIVYKSNMSEQDKTQSLIITLIIYIIVCNETSDLNSPRFLFWCLYT